MILEGEMRTFLKMLVEARIDSGLTQEDVAELYDWPVEVVQEFEDIDNSDPYMSMVRRYARAVGVVVEYEVQDIS